MELPSQRSVDPRPHRTSKTLTPVKLNPIAKAAFGVASVTFEVCARPWHIEGEVTLDGLDVEGTKQVRPDALGSLRSGAADSTFGEKGGR